MAVQIQLVVSRRQIAGCQMVATLINGGRKPARLPMRPHNPHRRMHYVSASHVRARHGLGRREQYPSKICLPIRLHLGQSTGTRHKPHITANTVARPIPRHILVERGVAWAIKRTSERSGLHHVGAKHIIEVPRPKTTRRTWQQAMIVIGNDHQGDAGLMQVACASHFPCRCFGPFQRRQKHGGKNGNDGNHHQQFDQRKSRHLAPEDPPGLIFFLAFHVKKPSIATLF